MTLTFDDYKANTSREAMLDEIYSLPDKYLVHMAFQVAKRREMAPAREAMPDESVLTEGPLFVVTSEVGRWAQEFLEGDSSLIFNHVAVINAITLDVLFGVADLLEARGVPEAP